MTEQAEQTEAPEVETPQETEERDWEAVAALYNYKGEEDYKGDPDKFMDAKTFVEHQEATIPRLQSLVDKINRERQRETEDFIAYRKKTDAWVKRLEKENERKIEEAVENGDLEAYRNLQEEKKELSTPAEAPKVDPTVEAAVSAFRERNPVITRSPMLQQEMLAILSHDVDISKSAEEQFREGEEIIRSRYPHLFPSNQNPKRQEAPAVSTGARTVRSKPAEKGYAELSPEVKDMVARTERRFKAVGKKLDREKYAKEYWSRHDD